MSLAPILLLLFFILGITLGPLALAVVGAALSSERGNSLGRKAIGLGLTSIYRPVVTFNPRNELTLKRRAYDEAHDHEYISFGGLFSEVKRDLFNPQGRYHAFYGTPFAFVDEVFGIVVDPRDVAVAAELEHEQSNGDYEHREVSENGQLHEAVRAVFELPRGHVGVNLPDVVGLVGGSMDSQAVSKIRSWYQTSQEPRAKTTAMRQLFIPIAAFIGVVLLGMFAAGNGGGGGGGAPAPVPGNTSTIRTGSMLVLLLSLSQPNINRRDAAASVVLGGATLAFAAILMLAFPMPFALLGIPLPLGLWALIALGAGMVVPAFGAFWFGRSLGPIGMALGKLYLIIGLLQFDQPVIDYDCGAYHVVEYDAEEWAVEPTWYRFAFMRIGVSFDNDEENWPEGTTLSRGAVQAMADGGEALGAPTGYKRAEELQVDGIHGFVPKDPADEATFVRTDRTTGWFFEAGQNTRLMRSAIDNAKEEFGGGGKPVGDKWILGATLAAIAMGAVFDMVVFF